MKLPGHVINHALFLCGKTGIQRFPPLPKFLCIITYFKHWLNYISVKKYFRLFVGKLSLFLKPPQEGLGRKLFQNFLINCFVNMYNYKSSNDNKLTQVN